MTPTVDRADLRRLMAGFHPAMTVEIRVSTLAALLDEFDQVDADIAQLGAELERLRFEGRRILALAERNETHGDEG